MRPTEREQTTALFLLRSFQLGLHIDDMKQLTIGMVLDLFAESSNDGYNYKPVATQEDFDAFAAGRF
ncbi:MAG: hypothetical protein IJH75_03835 [Mogibacterium sp.]|nr:hypothetical protein [Mogibacterium sp.]